MAKSPREPKTETNSREDEVLRRLLNTPPKPHSASVGKRKHKGKKKTPHT